MQQYGRRDLREAVDIAHPSVFYIHQQLGHRPGQGNPGWNIGDVMPTPQQSVADWVTRVESYLNKAGKTYNESREVERLKATRAFLQEFEAAQLPADDLTALKLLDELASGARDLKAAERYARLRLHKTREQFYEASESLARALFRLGHLEPALRHLETIPSDKRSKAARARIANIRRSLALAAASETATRLSGAGPRVALTGDEATALLNHVDEAQRPGAVQLLDRLGLAAPASFRQPLADDARDAAAAPVDLVFCGGFKWSGASALRDYLVDHQSVGSPPADLRLFTEPDFSLRGMRNAMEGNKPEAALRMARGFALEKILGLTLGKPEPKRLSKKLTAAMITLDRSRGPSPALRSALGFFQALMPEPGVVVAAGAFPRDALQDWLTDCVRVSIPEPITTCVFDSVLRAPDRALLSMLRDARLFAVFRDPRDMYATHVIRGGWSAGIEPYIADLNKMLAAFHGADDDNTTIVQYERFILSRSYRDAIGRSILATQPVPRDTPRFDPRDSAANIGIHRDFEDRDAIGRLEDAFPDLCIEDPKHQWQT